MTDYKELKLRASSSPHIRTREDTRTVMLDVMIALLPALAFAVYNFGLRALASTAVSVAGAVAFEALYRILTKKPQTVGDLSAAVTGMLIAFVCPVNIPYWTLLIADFLPLFWSSSSTAGWARTF